MKKLSLFILLLSLLCCVAILASCDTGECADGHTPVTLEAVAPTCTEEGLTEGSICSVCNRVITAQTKIPATGHEASGWIELVAATCTENGSRYKECKTCHVVLELNKLTASGHEYGAWKTITTANCKTNTEGLKERTCTVCEQKETEVVAITHRSGSWTTGAAATCTVDGFRYKTCKDCSVITTTETLAATGHTCESYTLLDEPTCVQSGVKQGHCTTCDTDFTASIAPLGHDYPTTWTVVTPVSCNNAGAETRTCRNGCGTTEHKTVEQLAHVKEWIVDVPVTCQVNGSRHEECTLCHEVFNVETLTAVPHDANAWTTLSEASCLQTGLKVRICPYCGLNEKQTTPKTGHTESEWIVDIVATCHASGARHKSCTTCSTVLVAEAVAQLTHTPGNTWIVDTAPSATATGTSKQICIACGDTLKSATNYLNLDATVVNSLSSTIDLSTYTIVYADSCKQNDKLFSYINDIFKPALDKVAGKNLPLTAEKNASTSNTAKQILIGVTARKESTGAFSSLQGRGFTVRVEGNKIIILGTDDLLTMSALQYFLNNYLNGAGKKVTIPVDATAAGLPVVALSSGYGSSYAYVVDSDLDFDPYHMYVGNSNATPPDGRDYPVYVFEELMARISAISGLPVSDFTYVTDANTTYVGSYEVLFGVVERAESLAFRATLDANQYGFRITGNKIILAAHIDAALEPMIEKFLAFYAYAMEYNGGVLPQGYEEVYTLSGSFNATILGSYTVPNWMLNFPRPENAVINMAQNNNDDSIQMIYTGTGASVSGYLAYCAQLENNGYRVVLKNDNPGNTNNYFRIYRNAGKQHVLYVAYNAFSAQEVYADRYASETVVNGDFIHSNKVTAGTTSNQIQYPMRTYEQCIRIVSAPLSKAYLPDDTLLTQQKYTKICNTSITNIRILKSVGMSYVLQLEDGRFVIVDGGGDSLYSGAENDKHILYSTLSELHKRATGSAPSTSNPIHIAAWLVTHSHADHYGTITNFLKTYAPKKTIKMDYLIGNFPELSVMYPVGGDTSTMGTGRVSTLQGYLSSAGLTPFTYVKLHTGMTLYFANLKLETMMTVEDHAPFRITNSNDTNSVTKWTISSTATTASATSPVQISASTVASSNNTTWMLLGDSCLYASRWLCAMWGGTSYNSTTNLYDGGYLKSDMVQLAHHGNIGCEIALYKTVQAEVVWFPHHAGAYNGYTQDSDQNWADVVDRYACNSTSSGLQTVKYIIVAGISGSSYTDSITISFNENGIYFPTSGNPAWGIKYNTTDGTYTTANIAYNTKKSGYNTSTWQRYDITYVNNSPVIKISR